MARIDFGLTSDEFWRLTPRQFVALAKRQKLARQREEWGPALITSALVSLLARVKKPPSVFEFMPSMVGKQQATQTTEEQLSIVKGLGVGRLRGSDGTQGS